MNPPKRRTCAQCQQPSGPNAFEINYGDGKRIFLCEVCLELSRAAMPGDPQHKGWVYMRLFIDSISHPQDHQ